jgi:hypothetical protein
LTQKTQKHDSFRFFALSLCFTRRLVDSAIANRRISILLLLASSYLASPNFDSKKKPKPEIHCLHLVWSMYHSLFVSRIESSYRQSTLKSLFRPFSSISANAQQMHQYIDQMTQKCDSFRVFSMSFRFTRRVVDSDNRESPPFAPAAASCVDRVWTQKDPNMTQNQNKPIHLAPYACLTSYGRAQQECRLQSFFFALAQFALLVS